MEKEGLVPTAERVYVCSNCFGKLTVFMLNHPESFAAMNLPPTLTANPVEKGVVESCEACRSHQATGFILCSPRE